MRSTAFLLCLFACMCIGCTSSYTIAPDNPEEITNLNRSLRGKEVTITQLHGAESQGTFYKADSDSLRWVKTRSQDTMSVTARSVKTVIRRGSITSGIGGFLLGLPIGALVGFTLGNSAFPSSGGHDDYSGLGVIAIALPVAAVGASFGGQLGYELGKDTYSFAGKPGFPDSVFARTDSSVLSDTLQSVMRIRTDSMMNTLPVRHVVAKIINETKEVEVFGTLLVDTPAVLLRLSKDRVGEISRNILRTIQPVSSATLKLSGLTTGWIVTRLDSSAVAADSLTSCKDGDLEVEYKGSKIVLRVDQIQRLEHCTKKPKLDDPSILDRGLTAGLVTFGIVVLIEGRSRPLGGLTAGLLAIPIAGTISKASSVVDDLKSGVEVFDFPGMKLRQRESILTYLIQQEREERTKK